MMNRTLSVLMICLLASAFLVCGCGEEEKEDSAVRKPGRTPGGAPSTRPAAETVPAAPDNRNAPDHVRRGPEFDGPAPPPGTWPPEYRGPMNGPETRPDPRAGKVKGPWAEATVDTMVKYRALGGATTTISVTEATDTHVTRAIKTDLGIQGDNSRRFSRSNEPRPLRPVARYYDPEQLERETQQVGEKLGEETIEAAGEQFECEVYEQESTTRTREGEKTITTRTYLCKDVPGWLVRVESNELGEMQTITQLVEYKQ